MRGKPIWIVGAVALVVLVAIRLVMSASGPDDKTLIREALAESIKASRENRPGSVIDKISDNFKVNDLEPTKRQIVQFIKDNRPDVEVLEPNPQVHADTGEASIVSPVEIKASFLGQNLARRINNVQIKFRREDSRVWLIFPAKQWRLTEVIIPQEEIDQFTAS